MPRRTAEVPGSCSYPNWVYVSGAEQTLPRSEEALFIKRLIAGLMFLVLAGGASANDALPSGVVEGHLKILALKEVELADGDTPAKTAENYSKYALIIRSRDGEKEIARVTADAGGNYRVTLPPGDYVLDVEGRARKHIRAKPQLFTVVSNHAVHVDMDIDTGIR